MIKQMFSHSKRKSKTHNMTEKTKWLIWATSLTLMLALFYLAMHLIFCSPGNETKFLDKDQLSTINSLIAINKNPADTNKTKELIYQYLARSFALVDSSKIIIQINKTELKQLQIILPSYPLKVQSFFWLNDPMVLLEIVFWSLFGLMANLLYSVTSCTVFKSKAIPEQIGKLFYTPFLAIIIFLSLNALLNSGSISLAGIGKSVIVLAFILGFYTRRAIVLLERVKDLILPAKEREGSSADGSTNKDKEQDQFKRLTHEEQKNIIADYIKAESANLKAKYPEIQGLSILPKKRAGINQDFYCLHFNLEKKINNLNKHSAIPEILPFKTTDGKVYNIPTDITGIGTVKLSYYTGNKETPKKLGLSCSRQKAKKNGNIETGSIGLRVIKNKEPHLLSCYHVLCAPELSNGIKKFSSSDNDLIISPSDKDRNGDSPEVIAKVTEGYLTNYIDAAIAKLTPPDSLIGTYYNYNGKPQGILRINEDHAKAAYNVKLVGRTSGTRSGHIVDDYEEVTYIDDYEFNELIVCSKMSDGGDSGATVTDYDNKVIGMLIADSDTRSYIIPIETILNTLNIEIDYKN